MPNPYKVTSLVLIAACSLGAVSMMPPRSDIPDTAGALQLSALYAAAPERVETHVLRNGQTLNGVLAQARITGQDMADLLLGMRAHLNPNRLAPGAEVTVRRWTRDNQPRAVEVRLNADQTVRLVKADLGWDGELVVTPTSTDTVYTSGAIDGGRTTLYETIVFDEKSQLNPQERPQLVVELAGIYEYKLDFTREIQPGDSYRIAYEREVRPDGTARSLKILAAEIVSRGTRYPAIWFEGSSDVVGYFDADARPLAHGFSRYPVAFPRITSRFNPNRYHPVLGQYRAHTGTDLGAPTGTPVMSAAKGTVTFAGTKGGYGRMIEISHFNGYTTRYAHLSRFASKIRAGTRVEQKDVIGYVGATGLATAPHLHYELRINGRPVDVSKAKLPDAPPIPKSMRERFNVLAAERSALLERTAAPGQYADTNAPQRGTARVADET
jgi:murein DD-endopeptidase MepM/ murein hydrolase activator NlpD